MAKLKLKNKDLFGMQSKFAKLLVAASIVLSCIASVSTASAQYKEVRRLGTSTSVCTGGAYTPQELQSFFAQNPDAITDILADAGLSASNADQLRDVIASGNFFESSYEVGTTFEWMSRKRSGRYESLPKRIWAGKEPFQGFEMSLFEGCQVHRIVIPKDCCNVSLAETTSTASQPTLNITTDSSSATACTAGGSSLYGTGPDGIESQLNLDGNGCATIFGGPGTYSFRATDSCGVSYGEGYVAEAVYVEPTPVVEAPVVEAPVVVEPAPEPLPLPVLVQKPVTPLAVAKYLPFLAPFIGAESSERYEEAWQEYRNESTGLLGLRGGVKLPLGKGLYAVPALGLHTRTSLNDGFAGPDESINLDLGLEKYISEKLFIGAGVGKWNIDDSDFDQNSVFLNVGGDLSPKTEWFAEARGLDSDAPEDGFSDNKAYGAGVRVKF